MGAQVYMMVEQGELDRISQTLKEIKDMLREKGQMQIAEQSISHKEAAAFLNITRQTLTKRLKTGVYPAAIAHPNGSKREYYKSELKELLSRKK